MRFRRGSPPFLRPGGSSEQPIAPDRRGAGVAQRFEDVEQGANPSGQQPSAGIHGGDRHRFGTVRAQHLDEAPVGELVANHVVGNLREPESNARRCDHRTRRGPAATTGWSR